MTQINTDYGAQSVNSVGAAGKSGYASGADYLNHLKENYPNASFSARDFSGASAIKSYAAGKAGELNDVAISPKALEKFAKDPKAAAKMEAELQEFIDLEQYDKDMLAANSHELTGRGMVVDKNGETSFWVTGTPTKEASDSKGGSELFDIKPAPSIADFRKTAEKRAEEKKAEEKRAKAREERDKLMGISDNEPIFITADTPNALTSLLVEKSMSDGALDVRA
jgi:hypothetical protein